MPDERLAPERDQRRRRWIIVAGIGAAAVVGALIWTRRRTHDLGSEVIELLAYTGDVLSYQQDRVATEAYLATERARASGRRHARLQCGSAVRS